MVPPPSCDDEPSIPTCRICMEPASLEDDLVQPCACAGTQAWIHIGCLQRWQQSSPNRSRKAICPVCKTAYAPEFVPREKPPASVSPLSLPYNWVRNAIAMASLGFANIFCNEPVIMVSILVITFIGCLDWSLPALLGVRLCMLVDEDGTPSLRLVRVGSNIQGLAAGALLVATDATRGGIFDRAVVVITRHDEEGTAGYLINCPVERISTNHPVFESGAPLRHALATPEDPFAVSHGLGGPISLDTWVVLHQFENVPGATRLGSGLHVGGDLATLRERARASLLDQRGTDAQQADARGAQAGAGERGRRCGIPRGCPARERRGRCRITLALAPMGGHSTRAHPRPRACDARAFLVGARPARRRDPLGTVEMGRRPRVRVRADECRLAS